MREDALTAFLAALRRCPRSLCRRSRLDSSEVTRPSALPQDAVDSPSAPPPRAASQVSRTSVASRGLRAVVGVVPTSLYGRSPPLASPSLALSGLSVTLEERTPPGTEECSICLAQISEGCVATSCGHRFHAYCLERHVSVSQRATCPLCRSALRPPPPVAATSVSGRRIEVLDGLPSVGSRCHFDREYRFTCLGGFNKPNMLYVLTSNEDKRMPAEAVMWTLEASVPTTVHINFRSEGHVAYTSVAAWLKRDGWVRSLIKSTVSSGIPNGPYAGPVFSKAFGVGKIELKGSNCAEGTYFVFVELKEASTDEGAVQEPADANLRLPQTAAT